MTSQTSQPSQPSQTSQPLMTKRKQLFLACLAIASISFYTSFHLQQEHLERFSSAVRSVYDPAVDVNDVNDVNDVKDVNDVSAVKDVKDVKDVDRDAPHFFNETLLRTLQSLQSSSDKVNNESDNINDNATPILYADATLESSKILLRAVQMLSGWDESPLHLNDDVIDPIVEAARCRRYNLPYSPPTHLSHLTHLTSATNLTNQTNQTNLTNRTTLPTQPTRRRIFYGSLIADDSWDVIAAQAMETHNVFHTVVLVESNRTQMGVPRDWRFDGPNGPHGDNARNERNGGSLGSEGWKILKEKQIFGRETQVFIEYYINEPTTSGEFNVLELDRENDQRSLILQRWKDQGMTPEDIGYISDVDELFSRDFLRAVQVCNVREFEPPNPPEPPRMNAVDENGGHRKKHRERKRRNDKRVRKVRNGGNSGHGNCKHPKVSGWTLVFEGGPGCLTDRRWFHPDLMIGACIEGISHQPHLHPTPKRTFEPTGWMLDEYTSYEGFSALPSNSTHFPLWNAADFRMSEGGSFYELKDLKRPMQYEPYPGYAGYHLHNFFPSLHALRHKYLTYGHPHHDAMEKQLRTIHEDLESMVLCGLGQWEESRSSKEGGNYPLVEGGIDLLKSLQIGNDSDDDFSGGSGGVGGILIPLAFEVPGYVEARMRDLTDILERSIDEVRR